jgi:cytidine deaminase
MMEDKELISLALSMLDRSYSPYSHFSVGAALEAEDGRVFTGCNVENAAYGSTICAERSALVKAVSEGARRFRRIAIAGSGDGLCWPCGACRQMLCEFAPQLEVLVASAQSGDYEKTSMERLLPHGFDATALSAKD